MTADPTAAGSPPEDLRVLGRIPSGSNLVYLCVSGDGLRWVYKPVRGEAPLPDFPDGTLAAREAAAWIVDRALDWRLVPETYLVDGPAGPGMAQRWVGPADPTTDDPTGDRGPEGDGSGPDPVDLHPVDRVPPGRIAVLSGTDDSGTEVVLTHAADERMRRIALLDHVINNADRKGGHVLRDPSGRVWAIDHGLAFHAEPKLRTVLWGWAGQDIPAQELAALRGLAGACRPGEPVADALSDLLTPTEILALGVRVGRLCEARVFPSPGIGYPLPWPLF